MDPRKERAQQLFWEVESQRKNGLYPDGIPKLLEMARLHEAIALELLNATKVDGWVDLYAAITAWGEAGARKEADRLLCVGRQLASTYTKGRENLERQLQELEDWLDALPPVPAPPAPAGALPAVEAHKT